MRIRLRAFVGACVFVRLVFIVLSGDKEAVARTMSHSTNTSDRYYRAYSDTTNLQDHQVIGKILEVSVERKRQRFTEAQTERILERFKDEIDGKLIPAAGALENFLAENRWYRLWYHCQQPMVPLEVPHMVPVNSLQVDSPCRTTAKAVNPPNSMFWGLRYGWTVNSYYNQFLQPCYWTAITSYGRTVTSYCRHVTSY